MANPLWQLQSSMVFCPTGETTALTWKPPSLVDSSCQPGGSRWKVWSTWLTCTESATGSWIVTEDNDARIMGHCLFFWHVWGTLAWKARVEGCLCTLLIATNHNFYKCKSVWTMHRLSFYSVWRSCHSWESEYITFINIHTYKIRIYISIHFFNAERGLSFTFLSVVRSVTFRSFRMTLFSSWSFLFS